jgi:hypothetical protein
MILQRPDRTRRGAPHQARTAARRTGRNRARRLEPLDAASLIMELEMATLIGQAGDSLRQQRDRRARRPWWRRLLPF